MKNDKLKFILILIFTAVLAAVSIGTAVLLRNRGTRPVAPSVPESKPKAYEAIPDPFASITPVTSCKSSLSVSCQVPPILPVPTIPQPPHSKLEISWKCDATTDCFTINIYEYGASGSGNCGRSCGSRPTGIVPRVINIASSQVLRIGDTCYYTDPIARDYECLDYEITAKDYTATKTCETCIVNDNQQCCLTPPQKTTICGLPAEPEYSATYKTINSPTGPITVKWKDNSLFESRYKIYRRESGTDGFVNILNSEVPIAVVGLVPGSGSLGQYIDNGPFTGDINRYVYSVRAETDLCGSCPTGTPTPTVTPTPSPTVAVIPTSTPTGTPVPACDRLEAGEVMPNGTIGDLSDLEVGDKIRFTVNFSGNPKNIAIRVRRTDVVPAVTVWITYAGFLDTGYTSPWTTSGANDYIIEESGEYDATAFITMDNVHWQ